MAIISLSALSAAFEGAFGYKSTAFDFPEVPTALQQTSVGTPYFSRDQFGRQYYMPVWLDNYELPYPVISIQERNILIETPMTERNGTVIESVGGEGVLIMIRGLIISKNKDYPEDIVRKLVELKRKKESLTITNAITDIWLPTVDRLGSDKVAIRSLSFPEVRGVMNVRPYEMELIGDQSFSLEEI